MAVFCVLSMMALGRQAFLPARSVAFGREPIAVGSSSASLVDVMSIGWLRRETGTPSGSNLYASNVVCALSAIWRACWAFSAVGISSSSLGLKLSRLPSSRHVSSSHGDAGDDVRARPVTTAGIITMLPPSCALQTPASRGYSFLVTRANRATIDPKYSLVSGLVLVLPSGATGLGW